jgi:CRP/FNR family transcriptional regulator, cyclic AMP receptor protein
LVRCQPEIALKIIEVLCARVRRTSQQVEDVLFLDLPDRLAKALLRLDSVEKSAGRGKVSMTQRELGQMIGMSRESTNKQLREWEDGRLAKALLRLDSVEKSAGRGKVSIAARARANDRHVA